MHKNVAVLLAILTMLAAACQSNPSPAAPDFYATATPSAQSASAPVSAALTPEPAQDYVTSSLPLCQGLQKLSSPIKFSWPNLETALQQLAEYNWGYYSCSSPQSDVAALFHEKMVKPPYNWEQTNWIENEGTTLGVYYHSVFKVWIYIWMLPSPDKKTSNLVISRSDPGGSMGWECKLSPRPSLDGVALLTRLKKDEYLGTPQTPPEGQTPSGLPV
jgi:hypothetical protein